MYCKTVMFTARRSYASAVLGVVILFSATQQWLVVDIPFHLKWALEVTHPLQKSLTSTDFRL